MSLGLPLHRLVEYAQTIIEKAPESYRLETLNPSFWDRFGGPMPGINHRFRQLRDAAIRQISAANAWSNLGVTLHQFNRWVDSLIWHLGQASGITFPDPNQPPEELRHYVRGASEAVQRLCAQSARCLHPLRSVLTALEALQPEAPPIPTRPEHRGPDSRFFRLEAPQGTPTVLKQAYEAVANALYQAREIWDCPASDAETFGDNARRLSATWRTAMDRYRAAEVLLRSVGEHGRCAHNDALQVTCAINDAVGHVMLRIVPLARAAENLHMVPEFDIVEMVERMRRQTSRATLEMQKKGLPEVMPQAPTTANASASGEAEVDHETHALTLLLREPELTIRDIADRVGVDRKTPYKWEKFREAAEKVGKIKPRGLKSSRPRRGHKTKDGRVEAYQDEEDDE